MSEKRQKRYQRNVELKRLLKISSSVTSEYSEVLNPQELQPLPTIVNENIIHNLNSFSNDGCENDATTTDEEFLFEDEDEGDYTEINETTSSRNPDISLLIFFWSLQFNITNAALSALLVILQPHFPDLPRDSRTFKKTPRKSTVEEMGTGSYFHFGLLETITSFLKKNAKMLVGNILNIDIGIDGLPLTKSSSGQFWPILGNIVGFSDIFVIGNFHGHSKPVDSEQFLKKFIEDGFDKIKNGIIFNGMKYYIKFRAFICDAPARSFVLQIKGHSGYSACTKCSTKGTYVLNRVTFPEVNATLRTDQTFSNRDDKNHHHREEQLGLEKINIGCVSQFPLDYMHCILLGVMKQLLNLWIKVKRRPFSLSRTQVDHISKLMILLCPQITSEFQRKPRGLEDFERFKATELRLFLLYVGPLVLNNVLPKRFYDHFIKFHCAVRILCEPNDCYHNNELANQLLIDFVNDFYILYGEHTITFNVHNLIHISDDVKYFGHLDNYSAFKFENYMQVLKKRIRKGTQPLKQLINRLKEEEAMTETFGYCKKKIPEFKRQLKDKSFMTVQLESYKLSIKEPNNFCLLKNDVIKITKICDSNAGVLLEGLRLKHLEPFFIKPFSSDNLNIYSTDKLEYYGESIKFQSVELKKVLHLHLNNLSVFMPNIHTN